MSESFDIYNVKNNLDIVSKNIDENKSSKPLGDEEKLNEIEKKLSEQRSEWGKNIIKLIRNINKIETLGESQVLMLSYRHMLIDLLTKFRIRHKKSEKVYEKKFKSKFISYYNYDYKIPDKLKINMVQADLSYIRRQSDLLESHIEYIKECISTLDKMAFAIKNRISFEEL